MEARIIEEYLKGKTNAQIAETLHTGTQRIGKAINFYQMTGEIPESAKMGRPVKMKL